MKVIIDRFEGDYAICEKEKGHMIKIDRKIIPVDAVEGDVLFLDKDNITIDIIETEKRRKQIEKLMDDLWN